MLPSNRSNQRAPGTFSALLPTYNRAAALRRNLAHYLALDGLLELIVVDDGSGDETEQVLAGVDDDRLRLIRHATNQGSPAARASAIGAARSDWVLMLDDDCQVPPVYGAVLLRVAQDCGADIISAPWVHAASDEVESEVAYRRSHPETRFGLTANPGSFPPHEIETPFLPPLVLGRRAVFETLGYRRRYRGNAWREETDFFISAVRRGFRCVLTPRTYSYQSQQFSGGQRRNRIAYEFWCFYNNWLFLQSHGDFLQSGGHIKTRLGAQARFVEERVGFIARGQLRKLARLRSD